MDSIRHLAYVDYAVIAVYFILMILVGFWSSRSDKNSTLDGYFLGGMKIPWWAAGLSLYATGTSALSFMAIPAKTYATNWTYYVGTLFQFFGFIFVAQITIPLIRRLNLTSSYEYLQRRFGSTVRQVGSAIFVLYQVTGRVSIVLLLPALALAKVTGLNVQLSILLMGVVTIIYTVKGGFTAVIWTDVIQVFVLLGSGLVALFIVVSRIDGGVAEVWSIANQFEKTKMFEWEMSLLHASVWILLLNEIVNAITWPKDQTLIQRAFSTPDVKSAVKSIWTLSLLVIPGSLLFFTIGTALFVFYQQHPERLIGDVANDEIFPYFISQEMPVGVVGLVIAGLFAASMSTLSSCLNSTSAAIMVDFYQKIYPKSSNARQVFISKIFAGSVGGLGVGVAIVLSFTEIPSLWDTFLMIFGIFSGSFGGVFALGLLTKRANSVGALAGSATAILVSIYIGFNYEVTPFLYPIVSTTVCMLVGYLVSLFGVVPKDLRGLTIYRSG